MQPWPSGILLNAVPKSAGDFIATALCTGLKLRKSFITAGLHFSIDLIVRRSLSDLALGGFVAHEHLPARRSNLVLLQRVLDRIIVHVRDPRQATLSWAHYMNELHDRGSQAINQRLIEIMEPPFPEKYFALSLTDQITWQIDNHLPILVDWIDGWLDADRDPKCTLKIKFTRFADFVSDPEAFFRSILEFYGIDRSFFPEAITELGDRQHFRTGKTDEWREVFTAEQAERATQMIPDRIKARFGW